MKRKTIKKYRFYPSFLFFRLDRWLKKMSAKGWHLIEYGSISFTFEEGEPCDKEYFTYHYGGGVQKGGDKYCLPTMHPFINKVYGIHRKRSRLNKETSCHSAPYVIIEIDQDRIDVKADIGYLELRRERIWLAALDHLRFFPIILIGLLVWLLLR